MLMNDSRPSWDTYYLSIAAIAATRSKDPSTKVGAVVAGPSNELLSTGYNGPPPTCDDGLVPWDERPAKYDWIIHAEDNALAFAVAAKGNVALEGCTLYASGLICSKCLLRAARHRIRHVVCGALRPKVCDAADESLMRRLAAACGVTITQLSPP